VHEPLHHRRGPEVAQQLRGERAGEHERRRLGRLRDVGGAQDRGGPDREPSAAEEAQEAHGAQLTAHDVARVGDHEGGHHRHGRQRGRQGEQQRDERKLARDGEAASHVELGAKRDDEADEAARGGQRVPQLGPGRKRRQQDGDRDDEAAADDGLGPALGGAERLGVALERLRHPLLLARTRVESHRE
jgi:hypothetical protein